MQSGLREQTLSGLQAISGGLDSLFHTCEVAARQLAGDDTVRGFLRGEAGATRYDAARMLSPVSYTHLDVYKSQR